MVIGRLDTRQVWRRLMAEESKGHLCDVIYETMAIEPGVRFEILESLESLLTLSENVTGICMTEMRKQFYLTFCNGHVTPDSVLSEFDRAERKRTRHLADCLNGQRRLTLSSSPHVHDCTVRLFHIATPFSATKVDDSNY